MTLTHATIWLFMLLLGGTAVAALVWAFATNQLRDFQAGATSIFDDDEPIGEMTDTFPGDEAMFQSDQSIQRNLRNDGNEE
ncbi:cbb3-type cytochrome oxidase assembly protein [Gimesia algae]|uniref:Cbb3-type cytochrome oxidase assembly protein CcoS n=1 Tax=Gimesia algae TaxID=2527971 RepID=A0A517VEU7_9PLAN|nr:hypothetical protein [Gimesia algae]QDT91538.1 hypothetical protein Pan161_31970 [Gimesia algae]